MSSPVNRAFRRRYRWTQLALGLLALLVIVFFIVVDWSPITLIGAVVAFVMAFLTVEFRGQRCPYCRGLVLGEISQDVGIGLLGGPPAACRTCGASLVDS